MNDLKICDHFKWSLSNVNSLTVREYNAVKDYLKELKREQDKMERKAKSARRRR
jgi:hypothetical protein